MSVVIQMVRCISAGFKPISPDGSNVYAKVAPPMLLFIKYKFRVIMSLMNTDSASKTARFQSLAKCVKLTDFQAFITLWPNSSARLLNMFLTYKTIRIAPAFEKAQVTR